MNAAVLLALTLVACGGRPPTVGPSASATTAAPTPSASAPASAAASAAPTLAATPVPTRGCPAAGFEPEVSLSVLTAQGYLTLDLIAGPMPAPVAVDKTIIPIETALVGGATLATQIQDDYGVVDAAFTSVAADFLPYDSVTPLLLETTIDGSTVGVTLIDRGIAGQLRVALAWSSACGSATGAGSVGLTIVPSSTVAGCPTTAEDLLASLSDMQATRITVGSLAFPIEIVGWSGRWLVANGADDFPEFSGWDRARSFSVAPEANVSIREAVDDLALLTVRASIFHREDVIAYLEPDSSTSLRSVAVITRSVNTSGRVNIPAPRSPGLYVFELQSSWQTSCLTLETYHVVSVEVQ